VSGATVLNDSNVIYQWSGTAQKTVSIYEKSGGCPLGNAARLAGQSDSSTYACRISQINAFDKRL